MFVGPFDVLPAPAASSASGQGALSPHERLQKLIGLPRAPERDKEMMSVLTESFDSLDPVLLSRQLKGLGFRAPAEMDQDDYRAGGMLHVMLAPDRIHAFPKVLSEENWSLYIEGLAADILHVNGPDGTASDRAYLEKEMDRYRSTLADYPEYVPSAYRTKAAPLLAKMKKAARGMEKKASMSARGLVRTIRDSLPRANTYWQTLGKPFVNTFLVWNAIMLASIVPINGGASLQEIASKYADNSFQEASRYVLQSFDQAPQLAGYQVVSKDNLLSFYFSKDYSDVLGVAEHDMKTNLLDSGELAQFKTWLDATGTDRDEERQKAFIKEGLVVAKELPDVVSKMHFVSAWGNLAIRYHKDKVAGEAEYKKMNDGRWSQTPQRTLGSGKGVCIDSAYAFAVLLKESGVPEEDVYVVSCRNGEGMRHALCAVKTEYGFLMIQNRELPQKLQTLEDAASVFAQGADISTELGVLEAGWRIENLSNLKGDMFAYGEGKNAEELKHLVSVEADTSIVYTKDFSYRVSFSLEAPGTFVPDTETQQLFPRYDAWQKISNELGFNTEEIPPRSLDVVLGGDLGFLDTVLAFCKGQDIHRGPSPQKPVRMAQKGQAGPPASSPKAP